MRYFKIGGVVSAFDDCEMTASEKSALEKSALSKVCLTYGSVENADFESTEFKELQRVKSIKIWIPDDAVEMTDEEIKAHLNPAKTIEEQAAIANAECTRRINKHWNQIGQINASLGVYGEEDTANCSAWISSNRAALIALLAREDLLEIDVTSDEHWPIFEGSN